MKSEKTSPSYYISGLFALNIKCPEESFGGWHFIKEILYAGEGENAMCNTNKYFGKNGIWEGSAALKKSLVELPGERAYIANHYRAFIDHGVYLLDTKQRGLDYVYKSHLAHDYFPGEQIKGLQVFWESRLGKTSDKVESWMKKVLS